MEVWDCEGLAFVVGASRSLLHAESSDPAGVAADRMCVLVEGDVAAETTEIVHSAEAAVRRRCSIVLLVETARMRNAEMIAKAVAEDTAGRSHRARSLVSRRMESHDSAAAEEPESVVSELAPLVADTLAAAAAEPD